MKTVSYPCRMNFHLGKRHGRLLDAIAERLATRDGKPVAMAKRQAALEAVIDAGAEKYLCTDTDNHEREDDEKSTSTAA